jgi:putative membrane protein
MVGLSETRSDRQEVVPMMNGYAMSGWGWLLMTLGMLGFWALVAVVAVALLRRPGQPDQQRQPGQPDQQSRPGAEEILAQRLARGELDPDEYRQRLQTLQGTTNRA